ncbi:MAG TPA: hypothetical protein VGG99_09720 [Acetobacteraceae bacterium]|jgi:hypothetical protein
MIDRHDGIDFDMVPMPAVMAPDGAEGDQSITNPFGMDTVELPAVVVPDDYQGQLPGDPFFLAGQVDPTNGTADDNEAVGGDEALSLAAKPTDTGATASGLLDTNPSGRAARRQGNPPHPSTGNSSGTDPQRTAVRALRAADTFRSNNGIPRDTQTRDEAGPASAG